MSAERTSDTKMATVVSFCDCAISSSSNTGSPVRPTLSPGTSVLVSATNCRNRTTAAVFSSSVGAWAVHVHAQSAAVVREGVAIGAGMHVRQQDAALGLRDVAEAPGDQGNLVGVERLDDARLGFRWHQRDIAVEDGRADRSE